LEGEFYPEFIVIRHPLERFWLFHGRVAWGVVLHLLDGTSIGVHILTTDLVLVQPRDLDAPLPRDTV